MGVGALGSELDAVATAIDLFKKGERNAWGQKERGLWRGSSGVYLEGPLLSSSLFCRGRKLEREVLMRKSPFGFYKLA